MRYLSQFVPKHNPVDEKDIKTLKDFIFQSHKLLILTGAGISTESGIPDYRSEGVGLYARSNHKPIQHQEFLKSALIRKRYWARNYIGWPRFSQCKPNATHEAVKRLELEHGKVEGVVTQNVDGLHSKAGSKKVIELHGTAFRVLCLGCGEKYDRHYVQELIVRDNPNMMETSDIIRPDGDVEISQASIDNFQPPLCPSCGGILKPDIVFFGDNVPRARVGSVRLALEASDALLVLGSSLSVFSGYRFVLQALELGKPVLLVNIGPTRADKNGVIKVQARCGDVLPKVC